MLRVLVVEDSDSARALLVHILESDGGIQIVGEAADGAEGVSLAAEHRPDVILMDISMPVMDGWEATRRIMEETPTPIVMVTSRYDLRDTELSFRALQAGAITLVDKPSGPASPNHASDAAGLISTVKIMADVNVVTRRPRLFRANGPPEPTAAVIAPQVSPWLTNGRIDVVAMAASTGGPASVAAILAELPTDLPVPILLVQHIAPGFQRSLVDWLGGMTPLNVRLAQDGERLRAGDVVVAPQDVHLGASSGRVELSGAPPIGSHRPSATHLFRSVAGSYGRLALGVILSGMGDDGVEGLLGLREAGGTTVAQDESTCVVYGMPGEAAARGAVDRVLTPSEIAGLITERARAGRL